MIVMKKLFFYIILLCSVCLNSCLTNVDTEKDLGIKPKLVLFCYLVPQLDTTIVKLTGSVPLFTTTPKNPAPIANAIVEISDNNTHWIKLDFDTAYKHYFIPQTDFPIYEGKTYYIRAAAPEFETVFASCKVPWLRETNLKVVLKQSNIYYFKGYAEWDDYPGEDNYYMLCKSEFDEHIFGNNWEYDTAYFSYWYFLYDTKGNPCIYSDNGQDGKKMSVLIETPSFNLEDSIVTFIQTDKNCYLFETSANGYDADFQLLMLEPMQLYSNVKNGYGVFGAFVMKDYEFEVEN
jgi:hypothetical protein